MKKYLSLGKISFGTIALAAMISLGCSSLRKERAAGKAHHQLMKISQGAHRSPENIARNVYRHPVETLEFFGLKPSMTVVEVSPGQGWYTEILAPFLERKGQLILAAPSETSDKEYHRNNMKALKEKLAKHPQLYGKVSFSSFEPPKIIGPMAPDATADMVLIIRNLHNYMEAGAVKEVIQSAYKALKPGGVLGIVDHRADPRKKQDLKTGYVREDLVIETVEAQGFQFVAKSEINSNYLDTKDYKEGVWTLPPSLKLKDKDRAKYLAIGESDRMTLKFVKP